MIKGAIRRFTPFTLGLVTLLFTGCVLKNIPFAPRLDSTAAPTLNIPYTLVAPPTDIPTPTAIPTPTELPPTLAPPPVPVEGAIGPYTFAANVDPLTGLEVADPNVLNRRPIVTKISNAPPLVRPQSGIGQADLVFEHYAEGGLTRFSAIFYSQLPERVGSIRSARLIDYELVPMYQALLAYSGASNGLNALISGGDFFERTYMGIMYGLPYYYRDDSIPVPHNMFTNLASLSRLATEEGLNPRPDLRGMAFLAEPPANFAGDANAIDIRYIATRVQWEFDPEHGVYRRISDGLPHYDANTNQQVTASNVVILFAHHEYSDIAESEWQGSISYGIRIKLWFEGDAILFRDGKQYRGRWLRPTREDMIQLRTNEGELLYFKPGNTFFQIMRLPEELNPDEEGFSIQ